MPRNANKSAQHYVVCKVHRDSETLQRQSFGADELVTLIHTNSGSQDLSLRGIINLRKAMTSHLYFECLRISP